MGNPPGIRELVPQDELLRALRNAKNRDDLPSAFMLRDNEKATGLSVSFDQTAAECQAGFTCTYGVASLTVQTVADAATATELQLQVLPDEPHHANITGVPHKEDDPEKAERLASFLAGRSTLVSTTKVDNR